MKKKPNTKFLFIAPWTSTDGDINSKLPYSEKIAMNQEYSNALQQWCKKRDKQNNSINKLYINPNKFIAWMLDCYPHNRYLIDAIHPNGQAGVQLYSESVLLYNE